MTCVVGLITDAGLIFGADTLVTTDHGSKFTLLDKKIFIKNNMIFGFCGDLRHGQLVKHRFTPPSPGRGRDLESFIHTKFVPELQRFFIDAGVSQYDDSNKNFVEIPDFELLVGINRTIYSIDGDFSVLESQMRYHAIGSGADYALGVMYGTKNVSNPTQRLTLALEAASTFSQTVGKPFHFETLPAPAKRQTRSSKKSKK